MVAIAAHKARPRRLRLPSLVAAASSTCLNCGTQRLAVTTAIAHTVRPLHFVNKTATLSIRALLQMRAPIARACCAGCSRANSAAPLKRRRRTVAQDLGGRDSMIKGGGGCSQGRDEGGVRGHQGRHRNHVRLTPPLHRRHHRLSRQPASTSWSRPVKPVARAVDASPITQANVRAGFAPPRIPSKLMSQMREKGP